MIWCYRWDVSPEREFCWRWLLKKKQKRKKGLCSGSYLHWIPLSSLSIWLVVVLREERIISKWNCLRFFFGFNVVAGLLWNTILYLLFSPFYVQFTCVFLFGLYLPLLTQSSLFLFSLGQTTVLPLPLAFLTYCRPCMAFSTEACLCSLFLYKECGLSPGRPSRWKVYLSFN